MLSEKCSYMFADSIKHLNGTSNCCKSKPGTDDNDGNINVETFVCDIFRFIAELTIEARLNGK